MVSDEQPAQEGEMVVGQTLLGEKSSLFKEGSVIEQRGGGNKDKHALTRRR